MSQYTITETSNGTGRIAVLGFANSDSGTFLVFFSYKTKEAIVVTDKYYSPQDQGMPGSSASSSGSENRSYRMEYYKNSNIVVSDALATEYNIQVGSAQYSGDYIDAVSCQYYDGYFVYTYRHNDHSPAANHRKLGIIEVATGTHRVFNEDDLAITDTSLVNGVAHPRWNLLAAVGIHA
jgi:hypothetical protein